jgi:hypothetical protein
MRRTFPAELDLCLTLAAGFRRLCESVLDRLNGF